MTTTIDIHQVIEFCFAGQFFIYGFMVFTIYPYNDFDDAPRIKHTVSPYYLRARRVLGMAYILLGLTAIVGIYPASVLNGGSWQFPLVPACLTLFFMAHVQMLLGLCDKEPMNRKAALLCLLPLPVLCTIYAVFPAWGEAIAAFQSVHLVLLIGWYTPMFYKEYDYLNRCCWDAVNETPNDIASDYDCLPESMPWIGHRYNGLLVITLLALLAHFLPYGWTTYVLAVLFTGYLFWFFYWVFQRFPRFARALFYYMREEDR